MKPILAIFLALLACSCGRKNESHEIIAWLMPGLDGIRYEIHYTALSAPQFARVLELGAKEPDISLSLHLPAGIAISNADYAVALAEQYGITNIIVKLNQTRPLKKETSGPDIIYEGQK